MVKNTTGGNKSKGHARKSFDKPTSFALRLAQSADEMYAQVTKPLGNGMCHVLSATDGMTWLCHIRGKFRGRGKSSNIVKMGSWLLVGRRGWETTKESKFANCDLLEVYTDTEIDKLKTAVKSVNWAIFANDEDKQEKYTDVEFTDANMDEYNKLIELSTTKEEVGEDGDKNGWFVEEERPEEIIDVDDI